MKLLFHVSDFTGYSQAMFGNVLGVQDHVLLKEEKVCDSVLAFGQLGFLRNVLVLHATLVKDQKLN